MPVISTSTIKSSNLINILVTALFLCFIPSAFSQTIIYVNDDASGQNNGTSWANAFTSIQDGRTAALTTPGGNAEVWVAEGIYFVDQGQAQTPGDRGATFALIDNTPFYGGFEGNESQREQRNWEAYPTIISGDIGIKGTNNDNAQTVVTVDNVNAILDGFIIEDGYSTASGAGVLIKNAFATLNNIILRFNEYDGRNRAYGGGIVVQGSSEFILTNSTLIENKSGDIAGGINVLGGTVDIDNTVFLRNESVDDAAALRLADNATVIIRNSLFDGNITTGFSANGGAIYQENDNSTLKISNSRLVNNSANADGGAIYVASGSIEVINSLIINNNAEDYGAAFLASEDAVFINTTIAFNDSDRFSAVWGSNFSSRHSATFLNCIIVDNSSDSPNSDFDLSDDNGKVEVGYTLIEKGDLAGVTDLGGNLVGGAVFFNPFGFDAKLGTTDDDFSLASSSLGLDAGLNIALDLNNDNDPTNEFPTDLAGFVRIYDGNGDSEARVDMGALESPLPAPQNLNAEAGDSEVSLSWGQLSAASVENYVIRRGISLTNISDLTLAASTSDSFLDNTASNYTTYFYQVAGFDSDGIRSRLSNITSARPIDLTPPSIPVGLEAIAGDSLVALMWESNEESDLASYIISRDTSTVASTQIALIEAGNTEFNNEGLTNNITYYYKIAAADTAGNVSNFSDIVSATPIGSAFLQFVHNSPDALPIEVSVTGENIVDSLTFGEATDFIELRSIEVDLLITSEAEDGSKITVLDSALTLIDERTYIFLANGLLEDASFELVINDEGRYQATNQETVDFFIFHGSPDAPTVEVNLLDATPSHNEIAVLANELSFGDYTTYRSVSPDIYNLEIVSSLTGQQVDVYALDVSELGGSSVTVVAGGFLTPETDEKPFGVFAYAGEVEPIISPVVTSSEDTKEIPTDLLVHGSYPNPFQHSAKLTFDLPSVAEITVELFDLLGRRVYSTGSKQFPVGSNQFIKIEGDGLAAAIYVYKMVVDLNGTKRIFTGKIAKIN